MFGGFRGFWGILGSKECHPIHKRMNSLRKGSLINLGRAPKNLEKPTSKTIESAKTASNLSRRRTIAENARLLRQDG
jgi:hypothetical protein